VTGRILPTSSACTSGSHAIGYGAETIRNGMQDLMIVGGADELSVFEAAVFDTLFATSTRNDAPQTSPRPFDRDRDGIVIGEGAATLILEELEHAKARGARIHAEVVGYGTNSDGSHVTQPSSNTMAIALRLALEDAKLAPEAIGFVNGHGTATEWGDIAESKATSDVLGKRIPIHALKSYFGHSLGACGSIEAWLGIEMMKDGWFAPTANLSNVDERCAELDYVIGGGRACDIEHLMSNNFAFGGLNTSLIFKRV
jgi:3-oxoacyl-[acyl-carrier-protein] synthase II